MSNGSWESIYVEQGRVQVEVLDTVVEACNLFLNRGYKRILDFGCGTGRHTYYLADKGFEVHACDISEAGVDITRNLIKEAGLTNVTYSIQNLYGMTLAEESYDGIICIWVQGHGYKKEMETGVRELHRVLKTGGTVVTDFVKVEDSTYGGGEEIAPDTFVGGRPGEEGIAHYYTTKNELLTMFEMFKEVSLTDKTYRFSDDSGKTHEIIAVVVVAKK
jgi:cyclopropane fatty-acyl-phospholipid synthase-like methyltransferase